MKLYIYLTNAKRALLHNDYSFILNSNSSLEIKNFLYVDEIFIDTESISNEALRKCAIEAIEAKEQEARAEFAQTIDEIEEEKQSLLAITHQSA